MLSKAITIQADQRRSAGGSKQLPADPFSRLYTEQGLVRPPYQLERLLELKEAHAIHAACIEQKSVDIAGLGWHWAPRPGVEQPSAEQRERLEAFLEACNPDLTFHELLQSAWQDWETLGWCALEVVSDQRGRPVQLYHVPAHTLRAHGDQVRFAQIRQEQLRWFKRRGAEGDFHLETGEPREGLAEAQRAGELIVIRRPGSRSSYYGIPPYVSALGSITGSLAVRDYNIRWFSERTIPDALLVVEGADVSPQVQAELRSFFSQDVKGQSHKLCILPVPGSAGGGEVRVRLERLMAEVKDASFRFYRHDNALEICIAHCVPPYRIGWPLLGGLGGATARETTEIYKRSVVEPGQLILEHRLNQQLFRGFFGAATEPAWTWRLADLDLGDQQAQLDYALKAVERGIFTPNQARAHLGHPPYAGGDVYYLPTTLTAVAEEGAPLAKAQAPVGAGEATGPRDRDWEDFAGLHRPLERELRENVISFFAPRQRGP